MYQAVPDSCEITENRRPISLAILRYLTVSILKQEDTLKELFRVHFPDSKLNDDSYDGQGQLNLGI
jgi:hypothetical protein